ncbi:hypothetical protein ENSA5_43520 [Enhygromyxa salina]|uniref:Uncharacterized protein n=1 Tax=Enhygromyxa salina TaxID=215803 RepID=A0A2S9XK97_9BACT|nr:hypothetical protein [Enhygromyxa salina]PRP93257.1 hypothetical protein ENSA5_43520 [Enhygromyxa salina]
MARGPTALAFCADALPEALQVKKRLPVELREASFFVYWPGDESPIWLPNRRPSSDGQPWMNKRGAAWKATKWLDEVIGRLPMRAVKRLMPGRSFVSRTHLRGDFDRRSLAWVRKALAKQDFEVLDIDALLAEDTDPRDDWDGLVLECVAGGGAAGSYDLRWLAGDRGSLREMADWLEDPESYSREEGASAAERESWFLHVVRGGEVERSVDLREHIRVDKEPLEAWLAGPAKTAKRVRVSWSAMKLPRPTKRRVAPGDEVSLRGLGPDEDDLIRLRHGVNE